MGRLTQLADRAAGTTTRRAQLTAAASALLYVAIATTGITRSYQYDEAVTISYFVREPSLVDALTRPLGFNNHLLLTLVDWLVHRAGGTTEAWMRLAPVAAAAATVGLIGWWAATRWGSVPAATGVAFVVSSPLFLDLTRQVRGYSFAVLAVTVSTLLVADEDRDLRSSRSRAALALAIAACLLSHLYTVLAIAGQAAHVGRRRRTELGAWLVAAAFGVAVAAPLYLVNLPGMLDTGASGRRFDPRFPLELASQLFTGWPTAIVGIVVLTGLAWVNRRAVGPYAAIAAAATAVVWLVVRAEVEPRYFVWLVPLAGLLAARAVHRFPSLALPLAAVILANVPAMVRVVQHEAGNRDVAGVVARLRSAGETVCIAGFYWQEYHVYGGFPEASPDLGCSIIVVRANDLSDADIQGMAVAGIPEVDGVCIAGRQAVLERNGLEHPCAGPDDLRRS